MKKLLAVLGVALLSGCVSTSIPTGSGPSSYQVSLLIRDKYPQAELLELPRTGGETAFMVRLANMEVRRMVYDHKGMLFDEVLFPPRIQSNVCVQGGTKLYNEE